MKNSLISEFWILDSEEGQSLLEILVALGVGTLLIIAATTIILPSLRTNTQADKVQVSAALGKQLLENVRVFSEGDWHNVSGLATSSANNYLLVPGSPFIAATGTEGISADGITSGLVGYWKLDESTGTTAYDFSGGNSTGTWNGTLGSQWTTGKIGGAGNFNGINNYVSVPSQSNLTPSGAFSVSAWLKTSYSTTTYMGIITKYASGCGGTCGYDLGSYSTHEATFNIRSGSNGFSSNAWSPGIIDDGAWHLVVGVFTGSQVITYSDGVAGTPVSWNYPSASDTTAFSIGARGGTSFFPGLIDDVRFYNRALSATEVKTLYSSSIYTRYFYIDNVGRDGSGNILSSGGTNDPSTKKLTAVYGWASGSTSSFSTYLTRFQNKVFDQTDWSGGPGQEGPATTTNNMFSTSTSVFYATTTGSIMIQLP